MKPLKDFAPRAGNPARDRHIQQLLQLWAADSLVRYLRAAGEEIDDYWTWYYGPDGEDEEAMTRSYSTRPITHQPSESP